MSTVGIRISDHCIVRYFERHYGIDIEKIRREILPDHIREKVNPDDDTYVIKDIEFRIINNSVVTCVSTTPNEPTKLKRNKAKRHISNKNRKDETWQTKKKHSKKNKKGGYR